MLQWLWIWLQDLLRPLLSNFSWRDELSCCHEINKIFCFWSISCLINISKTKIRSAGSIMDNDEHNNKSSPVTSIWMPWCVLLWDGSASPTHDTRDWFGYLLPNIFRLDKPIHSNNKLYKRERNGRNLTRRRRITNIPQKFPHFVRTFFFVALNKSNCRLFLLHEKK